MQFPLAQRQFTYLTTNCASNGLKCCGLCTCYLYVRMICCESSREANFWLVQGGEYAAANCLHSPAALQKKKNPPPPPNKTKTKKKNKQTKNSSLCWLYSVWSSSLPPPPPKPALAPTIWHYPITFTLTCTPLIYWNLIIDTVINSWAVNFRKLFVKSYDLFFVVAALCQGSSIIESPLVYPASCKLNLGIP